MDLFIRFHIRHPVDLKEWTIVRVGIACRNELVDEEIRKNQLERKVENGELASFGEKYAGQFDKDIYTAEDKGMCFEWM